MPNCPYCNTAPQTEDDLTAHLEDAHSREELSRIDRKRIEQYEQASSSRLRKRAPVILFSVTVAAIAIVGVGLGAGVPGLDGGVPGFDEATMA
jgi:hypothetical protein